MPVHWPATIAQRGIWLFEQSRAGRELGLPVQVSLSLQGGIDVNALRAAHTRLVTRNPVLRSTFVLGTDGVLVQRLNLTPATVADVEVRRLGGRGSDPQAAADRAWQDDRGIDLTHGPLWRLRLVQLGQDEHVLQIMTHHILLDGLSIAMLLRQLSDDVSAPRTAQRGDGQSAEDGTSSRGSMVAPLVEGQDRQLDAGTATDLAHWRDRLAGIETQLPAGLRPSPTASGAGNCTDGQNPAHQEDREEFLRTEVAAPSLERVVRSGAAAGVTPTATLLAAFAVAAGRALGRRQVVVATPFSGRVTPELAETIGMLVNILPVCIDAGPGRSFAEVRASASKEVLEAMEYQGTALEVIAADLGAWRGDGQPAQFPLFFQVEPGMSDAFAVDGVQVIELRPPPVPARFDLALRVKGKRNGGCTLSLGYRTSVVGSELARRVLERTAQVLAAVQHGAAAQVGQICPLSDEERAVVARARRPPVEGPDPVEAFAAHVRARPDAAALVDATITSPIADAGAVLTYYQLDARVEELARRLPRAGVVALVGGRSAATVIGILACLRRKRPFLVLNPDDPSSRRQHILDSSGAVALVDSTGSVSDLAPLAVPIEADDLAYVSYTSGSSGTPKGVLVGRAGLANYLIGCRSLLPLRADDVVLQLAPPGYDAAIRDILLPLTCGARVHLVSAVTTSDPARLLESCRSGSVTAIVSLIPSVLRQLRAACADRPFPESVRLVVCVGEPLRRADAEWLLGTAPRIHLFNTYGPTEGTLTATLHDVRRGGSELVEQTVGRPLPGVSILVLDEDSMQTPPGLPGEVCIGGAGVAAGYLGNPALTARHFSDLTVPGFGNMTVFRTGDRGALRSDGGLHLLGRTDGQVKIAGTRIEVAEIEHVVQELPGVADCLVRLETTGHTDVLVAYVLMPGGGVSDRDLREHVAQRLPPAMRPRLVPVERFPKTSSGKIDARALAAAYRRATKPTECAKALTPVQRKVLRSVARLLGLDQVELDDNFTALGGHSLLAMALASQLWNEHGLAVDVRDITGSRDLLQLADHIAKSPDSPPSAAETASEWFAVTPNQENRLARHWSPDRPVEPVPQRNLSISFRINGELDSEHVRAATAAALWRHDGLRAVFALRPDGIRQRVAPVDSQLVPFELVDTSAFTSADIAERARQACQAPFDLTRGGYMRIDLLRIGPAEHILVFVVEHIVVDGLSGDLLIRTLWNDLRLLREGRPLDLSGPPLDYRRWVLREAAQTAEYLDDLSFWRQELGGSTVVPQSPFSGPPEDLAGTEPAWSDQISGPNWSALRARAAAARRTPFLVSLTAMFCAIRIVSGQEDLTVQVPIGNRANIADEAAVGWLSNMLTVRASVSAESTFEQVCVQIQHTFDQANRHSRLAYPRLLKELQPELFGRPTPFRVMFGYHYAETTVPQVPGLEISDVDLGVDAAGLGDPGLAVQAYDSNDHCRLTGLFAPTRMAASEFRAVTVTFRRLLLRAASTSDWNYTIRVATWP